MLRKALGEGSRGSSVQEMSSSLRKLLWACWLTLAKRAARCYVSGPELADALRACCRLSQQGFASTTCFWNRESDNPRQTADAYLATLDVLARVKLNCQLSIKAAALGFARELVAEVLERAREGDVSIHFDSLGPEGADETFSLIAGALPHYPKLGCTLPGRWRRSPRDADRAIELGVSVRVVKGQWVDPDEPEIDLRAGFLAIVDRLAGRARHVAVATHDPPLAREALGRLRAAGTSCEMELLFGLAVKPVLRVARAVGVPVRFYVPYGHGSLPYCLSHARQNPRIFWWMVRDSLHGRARARAVCSGSMPGTPLGASGMAPSREPATEASACGLDAG